MRNTRFMGSAGLAGIAALAATLAAGTARAEFQDIYSAGHADVNISYDSGLNALHLNYDFGTNAVINGSTLGTEQDREANTITVFINPSNATIVGPAGLPPPFGGNTLYTIPQTQKAGRPFLGLGAETVEPGLFQDDLLRLTLTGITRIGGAGQFVLYQTGTESTPFMDTANGITSADYVDVFAGGHDHYNYGFTSLGIYDLTFTATGTLKDGTPLSTSEVYRFQVGDAAVPEPSSLALVGIGLGAVGLVAARRKRARNKALASA